MTRRCRRCRRRGVAQSRWGEPLPDVLVQLVFTEGLPADARARCGSVCRAWADALLRGADAWRCWTRVDLSVESGVTCAVGDEALEGAAALARGRLQELDVRNKENRVNFVTVGALRRVMRDNSAHLRQLTVGAVVDREVLQPAHLRQLLDAAGPALQELVPRTVHCGGFFDAPEDDLLPLLRGAPPFGRVRVDTLCVQLHLDADDLAQLAAAVATAQQTHTLRLSGLRSVEPAALDALVDALLAPTCRVEALSLEQCDGVPPTCLPAVARLLAGGGALSAVHLRGLYFLFIGASDADTEACCAALRRSTLTSVHLQDVGLARQQRDALYAACSAAAAAAAPRLRHVDIRI